MFLITSKKSREIIPGIVLTSNVFLSTLTGAGIGLIIGTFTSIKHLKGFGLYYGGLCGGIGSGIQSAFIYPEASPSFKVIAILTGIISGALVAKFFEERSQ
ncbi:hypothetical protein BpHYR1_003854 [Brachionus plicatilis]|uniref:Uncharacterized protein n=1 Tax=Brachionus plicatilis TaxID=10195 RepID=A0A3M7PAR1_BRAPC|nr:hypothetical protein BpHYR1_003854 [Brachionus plicatilis]